MSVFSFMCFIGGPVEHLHCKSLWLNGHNVLPRLPSVSGKISALFCSLLSCCLLEEKYKCIALSVKRQGDFLTHFSIKIHKQSLVGKLLETQVRQCSQSEVALCFIVICLSPHLFCLSSKLKHWGIGRKFYNAVQRESSGNFCKIGLAAAEVQLSCSGHGKVHRKELYASFSHS